MKAMCEVSTEEVLARGGDEVRFKSPNGKCYAVRAVIGSRPLRLALRPLTVPDVSVQRCRFDCMDQLAVYLKDYEETAA